MHLPHGHIDAHTYTHTHTVHINIINSISEPWRNKKIFFFTFLFDGDYKFKFFFLHSSFQFSRFGRQFNAFFSLVPFVRRLCERVCYDRLGFMICLVLLIVSFIFIHLIALLYRIASDQ